MQLSQAILRRKIPAAIGYGLVPNPFPEDADAVRDFKNPPIAEVHGERG
jgi:hypothetical protein